MTTGRKGPQKPQFTFSGGITVTLERVGPMVAAPVRKAFPPPQPPLAPGVGGALEPNPADPDYLRAIEAYNQEFNFRLQDVLLLQGIGDDLVVDHEAVARLRRTMADLGAPIPETESDRLVYIKYLVVASADDIPRFVAALAHYDTPQEDDVSAASAVFPGDVPRAAA